MTATEITLIQWKALYNVTKLLLDVVDTIDMSDDGRWKLKASLIYAFRSASSEEQLTEASFRENVEIGEFPLTIDAKYHDRGFHIVKQMLFHRTVDIENCHRFKRSLSDEEGAATRAKMRDYRKYLLDVTYLDRENARQDPKLDDLIGLLGWTTLGSEHVFY